MLVKTDRNLWKFFISLCCWLLVYFCGTVVSDGREGTYMSGGLLSVDFNKLTVWIEGKEIEHFVGFPLDIFIIQDGVVAPYLQDARLDLPILPPEVTKVQISWMGRDDMYSYKFPDLRSLDRHVMFDPLMSIRSYGIVPDHKESFQISLACTGEKTGIASMHLSLGIVNSRGIHIQGSPLKLHIRKRCIAFAESKTDCEGGCKNGGTCESGKCKCKAGYFGTTCQYVSCFPACMNNGSCIKPGKCVCPKGYTGDRCQRVRCKGNCSDRGVCISPNKCSCPPEYYGDRCQHETGQCSVACQNGGTCNENDVCHCPKGYLGQFCQKPVCKKTCGVHGYCAGVNTCECHRGWRGRFCHKTVHKLNSDRPRKHGGKSRKQRHTKKGKKRKGRRKRKKIYV